MSEVDNNWQHTRSLIQYIKPVITRTAHRGRLGEVNARMLWTTLFIICLAWASLLPHHTASPKLYWDGKAKHPHQRNKILIYNSLEHVLFRKQWTNNNWANSFNVGKILSFFPLLKINYQWTSRVPNNYVLNIATRMNSQNYVTIFVEIYCNCRRTAFKPTNKTLNYPLTKDSDFRMAINRQIEFPLLYTAADYDDYECRCRGGWDRNAASPAIHPPLSCTQVPTTCTWV